MAAVAAMALTASDPAEVAFQAEHRVSRAVKGQVLQWRNKWQVLAGGTWQT